jgi:hypothetical protein
MITFIHGFITGLSKIPPDLGSVLLLFSPLRREVGRVPPADRRQRLLTREIPEYALIVGIESNGKHLQGAKSDTSKGMLEFHE